MAYDVDGTWLVVMCVAFGALSTQRMQVQWRHIGRALGEALDVDLGLVETGLQVAYDDSWLKAMVW